MKINLMYVGILLLFPVFLTGMLSSVSLAHEEESLRLQSEAAVLIDTKSGNILYQKNSTNKMYPASITKILTGIIAIEEGDLEDVVTVSQKARNVVGTRVYLVEGEQVPLLKLEQGLLINSGNDAGVAIAEHMDQDEKGFSNRMNRFAKEKIGVTRSNFTNPHGLFNEDHYTTAYDMALITRYAMKNNVFREIVGTKEMEWIGEGWETTLYNHHKLLWRYEGANGVKNGFVNQSGHTLVTSAKRGNMELIAVTLKANSAENAYQDTINLMDYGFSHFQTHSLPADRVFLDQDQNQFRLTTAVSYTTQIDEEVTFNVNESGELEIINENQEMIIKLKLEKIEEKHRPTVLDSTISVENEGNTEPFYQRAVRYALWVAVVIYQMFLLLISYLLVRKYRKKKQNTLQLNRIKNQYWR
jgi:D-alanyl-D-alanine carboxypeptidase